jgi:hypothetical protein
MMAAINWGDVASKMQIAGYITAVLLAVGGYAYRKLRSELKPNHGSSLRDAVDRIEKELTEVRHLVEKHEAYHDGLNDQ